MEPKPEKRKSEPARNSGTVCAVRRMSDSLTRASLPEHDSRSRSMTRRFSASSSRMPSGTQPTTLAPSMPPFCTPWAPMARASATQRDSRLNMERPSAAPMRASAPPPLVTRILSPREA